MAFVESFGAAQVVTGSCHLLTLEDGKKILIDCGMFQGELEEKNAESFGFNPKDISYLILTHAHLDHVGRAPLLYKSGFRGEIISTRSTLGLASVILLDSAHLMKENYYHRFKKAQRCGEENKLLQPLYTSLDVESLLTLQKSFMKYEEPLVLDDNLSVTFHNAGHILGSAFVEISFLESGMQKTIVFSGDLGNKNDFLLPKLVDGNVADALYIESTYGDREHKNMDDSISELKKIVIETLKNDGNVLIPSFAVDRTQELLCIFKQMSIDGELPKCRIFLDSPMAIRATRLYNKHVDELSQGCQDFMQESGSIFDFANLEYIQTPDESKKINEIASGAIIIAGAGMCSGGRILHHFKHRLWNDKNAVIFVGFQAKDTLGRKIVEGAEFIELYNEKIIINASIHTVNGFSAHGDQKQMIEWMNSFERVDNIYIVHGEENQQVIFKEEILKQLEKKAHIVKDKEHIYV
ncbi:RNA-metabolising metallo-beta-lactamase [Sulfurimonas gotlandica GD1]|jgi:metallo-beta-lactamase family protein|uniref:RNA-metabolising metallo-beta-lactamase n=1 Tax=Sulfurimonas gotlandica (strain DSM 19862 / JCM 16533 / GD1) TaxID=929558 RepID=B6BMY5_SULGG|nr:MBL fold metallo-hydrolase [Sulfurimonas gotlandica]EDZ61643.1 beta-lactamase domain protein [Sulfurimonas gotlandica GD1]EHP30741.1 RNA-metabolising metallo-beta-lactamase [Sulfurimonas gotlandica GD1]